MDLGVMIFPTDKSIQPVQLAKEVEARGFESLWFPEHSHIPTSRETPWGGMKNAPPLPEMYWRSHDQFVALAALAGKIDMISNGRFELGVGYGWCVEEMRNHGLDYKKRRAILRENILLCRELWTQDEASFSGETIQFEKSWAWPKPVQKRLPVVMGGAAGPKTAAHIAEFCDGWMPLGGAYDFDGGKAEIAKACEAIGRDPASVSIGMFYAMGFDADQVKEHSDKGAVRGILPLPSEGPDVVLKLLDDYAKHL